MINDTETALQEVLNGASQLILRATEDNELLHLSLLAIAAGSFKVGYEKGRLAGRAEHD